MSHNGSQGDESSGETLDTGFQKVGAVEDASQGVEVEDKGVRPKDDRHEAEVALIQERKQTVANFEQ